MRARHLFLTSLFIFLLSTISEAADGEKGHIQIKCDAGIKVFLDSKFQGVSSLDEEGIILMDVPSGRHTVKLVKEGFHPQDHTVILSPRQVYVLTVGAFIPEIKISERGKQGEAIVHLRTGKLIVQSIPIECKITIPKLGLNDVPKKNDVWEADGIPEEQYSISFSARNKTLSLPQDRITISSGYDLQINVNLLEGTYVVEKFHYYGNGRFRDNGIYAVIDTKTKLMWSRDIIGSEYITPIMELFAKAMDVDRFVGFQLKDFALAGYTDWRVPTKEELLELYSALSSIKSGKNRMVAPFRWSDDYFISSLIGRVTIPKEYQNDNGLYQYRVFVVDFETGESGFMKTRQMRFNVTRVVREID